MIHHRSCAEKGAHFAAASMKGQQCSVGIAVCLMTLDLLLCSWRVVGKSRQLRALPPLLWEGKGKGDTECGRARQFQKAHKKHLPSAYSLLSLSSYITPCYGGSVQMAWAMLLMQLVVRMSHGRLNWGGFSFVSSHKTCHFWHIQRQQGCPW